MNNKKASIKDVAKHAGVSLATVSRVVNNLGNVSEELSEKVYNSIKELGYIPNSAARSLVMNRTYAIGIVVHNLHDPFFNDLIYGFEMGAKDTKYSLVFCSVLGGETHNKEKYIKFLTNGVVDSVILYGSYLTDTTVIEYLKDINTRDYVIIENDTLNIESNKLLIDNIEGAKQAVRYLKDKGHEKIAHICGNPNKKVSVDRMNGYLVAMLENELAVFEGYIQYTTKDYKSGYDKMMEILKLKDRPTAVFCSDDAIASYAIRAIYDSGLSVPEDISIVGFDNQSILPGNYSGPNITSIKQPLYDIGKNSIELVISRLENPEKDEPVKIVYKTEVIERDTVRAI